MKSKLTYRSPAGRKYAPFIAVTLTMVIVTETQDADEDQLVCKVRVQHPGEPPDERTHPGEKRVWNVKKGGTHQLHHELYDGRAEDGMEMRVQLFDRDFLTGNDLIGTLDLRFSIAPPTTVACEAVAGPDTEVLSVAGERAVYRARMRGSGADYEVELSAYIVAEPRLES